MTPFFREKKTSDGFITRLHICAVVQTLNIYKNLFKLCTIDGGKQLLGDRVWPLNNQLCTTAEQSIKLLHWTIGLAPLLNIWFSTD